jgi:hypothetical protein
MLLVRLLENYPQMVELEENAECRDMNAEYFTAKTAKSAKAVMLACISQSMRRARLPPSRVEGKPLILTNSH